MTRRLQRAVRSRRSALTEGSYSRKFIAVLDSISDASSVASRSLGVVFFPRRGLRRVPPLPFWVTLEMGGQIYRPHELRLRCRHVNGFPNMNQPYRDGLLAPPPADSAVCARCLAGWSWFFPIRTPAKPFTFQRPSRPLTKTYGFELE